MIIYTDGNAQRFGGNLSPAMVYQHITDFSQVLAEIESGNLPTNSGQPFDVNYDLKQQTDTDENRPPWVSRTDYNNAPSSGFFNPWSKT